MPGTANPHASQLEGDCVFHRSGARASGIPPTVLERRYELLGLDDIDVGYAGSKSEHHPIHAGLAELQPGSLLQARVSAKGRVELVVDSGPCVARLSTSGSSRWCDKIEKIREIRVVAVLRRYRTDEQPEYRDRIRRERWEVPVVEFVHSVASLACSVTR
jgi:ATP-dependent DNA helicase RecQ